MRSMSELWTVAAMMLCLVTGTARSDNDFRATIHLVALTSPSSGDVVTTLPGSLAEIRVGDTFYLEVWAQTPEVGGLAACYVDIFYDPARVTAVSITHTAAFNVFGGHGTVDQSAGLIDDVGDAHLDPGCDSSFGTEPTWVRSVIIEMHAQATGPVTLQSAHTGSEFGLAICGIAGLLGPDEVDFGGVNLAVGCQSAGDCDDGVDCTDDACDDGACVFIINNGNCPDDGLFCNGTEYCDGVLDCSHTGEPCSIGQLCDEAHDACFALSQCQLAMTDPMAGPSPNQYRWKDIAGVGNNEHNYSADYQATYTYGDPSVIVTLEYASISEAFQGMLEATNLKPNFAYQIKIVANPDALYVSELSPAEYQTLHKVASIGRWWDFTTGAINPPYNAAHQMQSYLLFDHFETDNFGNASKTFYADSSFHVLFDSASYYKPVTSTVNAAGPPPNDIAYAEPYPPPEMVTVSAQNEHGTPGSTFLPPGRYEGMAFLLTEESFHESGIGGYWASAMACDIAFDIMCGSDADCDDGVGCTDDACVANVCVSTVNDGNCPDDGLFCNGTEYCHSTNDCSHTGNPCAPADCDESANSCVGLLWLEVTDGSHCPQPGQLVAVALRVSDLTQPINGAQLVIQYDVDRLLFDSISAGDGAGSPWDAALPIYEAVVDGEIGYGVGLPSSASDEDAVVATVRFQALANGLPEVELLAVTSTEPFLVTKLTAYSTGGQIVPELGDPVRLVISNVDYGDSNGDGTVNLDDYAGFGACQSGPSVGGSTIVYPPDIAPACICLDADGDGDVDLGDFGDFQGVFTGGPG